MKKLKAKLSQFAKQNFKAASQKLEKSSHSSSSQDSLLLGHTKGFADFLPSNSWEWFVSARYSEAQ